MYGIKSNLIRGLGFIIFNMTPPRLEDIENESNNLDVDDDITISSHMFPKSMRATPTKVPTKGGRGTPRSPMKFDKKTRNFEFLPSIDKDER